MLSNTGYESWENPPEEYEEPYFDECEADELRHDKRHEFEQQCGQYIDSITKDFL